MANLAPRLRFHIRSPKFIFLRRYHETGNAIEDLARNLLAAGLISAVASLGVTSHLSAQSFTVGAALVGDDVDPSMLRGAPEHDMPPPPGLERMSVSQALQEHGVSWVTGDVPSEGGDVGVHVFHLNRGKVVGEYGGGQPYYAEEEEEMQMVPLRRFMPRAVQTGGFSDARVEGYALAQRKVATADALTQPDRLIAEGVFDISREQSLGDLILVLAAPTDREMMRRAEAVAFLVMF